MGSFKRFDECFNWCRKDNNDQIASRMCSIKVAFQSEHDLTQSFTKTNGTKLFENNEDSINHK